MAILPYYCLLCYGQVVVLIGSAASAVDISIDIAQVAKEIHIASRSVEGGMLQKLCGDHIDNMWLHPMVKSLIFGTWLSKDVHENNCSTLCGRWIDRKYANTYWNNADRKCAERWFCDIL